MRPRLHGSGTCLDADAPPARFPVPGPVEKQHWLPYDAMSDSQGGMLSTL